MSEGRQPPEAGRGHRGTVVSGLLLRLVPRDLRESYGPELRETLRQQGRERRYQTPAIGTLRFLAEVGIDLVRIRWRRRAEARAGGHRPRRHDGHREPVVPAHRGRSENMAASLQFALRDALRRLRRNPGFTAAALATLAIGIGANTLMFSLVDGILVRPLPFPESHELVAVYDSYPERDWLRFSVSAPNFFDCGPDESLRRLPRASLATGSGKEAPLGATPIRVGYTAWSLP